MQALLLIPAPFLGVGAFASPIAATQFAQMRKWSFHYLVSLGIAITNTIALIVVFRFKRQSGKSCLKPKLLSRQLLFLQIVLQLQENLYPNIRQKFLKAAINRAYKKC